MPASTIEAGSIINPELASNDLLFTSSSVLFLQSSKIDNCVWAFQFDDDEPIVFATSFDEGQNQLTFVIDNSTTGSLEFNGLDGKKLKIFAKENK
jgi:hypothetical protein